MKVELLKSKVLGTVYVLVLAVLLFLLLITALAVLLLLFPKPPTVWFRHVLAGIVIFLNVVSIATLLILNRAIAVSAIFGAFGSLVFWAGWFIPAISVAIAVAGGAAWSNGFEFDIPPPSPTSGGGSGWDWD